MKRLQQICCLALLLWLPALLAQQRAVSWPQRPLHARRPPAAYPRSSLPGTRHAGRIVEGSIASRGQFKHQVGLMIDGNTLCGGVLVSARVVLTSAQCCASYSSFQAHLGAQELFNFSEEGRQTITSSQATVHEDFNPAKFNHDIALVILPSPAVTSEYVQPIAMAQAGDGDFAGAEATISGWGTTADGSVEISNELRYNSVRIISNAECSDVYGPEIITSSVVCQSGADVGSPCLGDSGTGLVVSDANGDMLLVGTSSFISASGQCEGADPAGYMRVSEYQDWIAENSP